MLYFLIIFLIHTIVPEVFKTSIVFPLYKSGDINLVGNYRGISLQNTLYKVFMSILQFRLQLWVNNNIINETQAGFRRGYSTIDNYYILNSLIEISKYRNKELFIFFIDFKAAFDSINWNALFYKLKRIGISHNFVHLLHSIYSLLQEPCLDKAWFDGGI